jgi:hypothetical protein
MSDNVTVLVADDHRTIMSADPDDPTIRVEWGNPKGTRYIIDASGEQLDLTRPIDIYQDHGLVAVYGSHIRVGLSLPLAFWIACEAGVKISAEDGRTYRLEWGSPRPTDPESAF